MELNDERIEILEDLDDIRADMRDEVYAIFRPLLSSVCAHGLNASQEHSMRRATKRLNELKDFRAEAQLRLPKVEKEIDSLTPEDIEHNWHEAFGNEYEKLTGQLHMAHEEMRLQRVHIRKCKFNVMFLRLEMEDVEVLIGIYAHRCTPTHRHASCIRLINLRGFHLLRTT